MTREYEQGLWKWDPDFELTSPLMQENYISENPAGDSDDEG
jgi:hypothetical protein